MRDAFLSLIQPPAEMVVSLDEVKTHLRVDGDHDDARITAIIASSTSQIDGQFGWLNRALCTQKWALNIIGEGFGCAARIHLPLPPLQSVDEISYTNADGVEQVLPSADYVVVMHPMKPYVTPAQGKQWPSGARDVKIEFTAGYGDGADVPADIRHYVLLSCGDKYQHGESAVVGTIISEIPAFVGMLTNYRVF